MVWRGGNDGQSRAIAATAAALIAAARAREQWKRAAAKPL
jgi:hypothetical protein